jgi:hypothetical protein
MFSLPGAQYKTFEGAVDAGIEAEAHRRGSPRQVPQVPAEDAAAPEKVTRADAGRLLRDLWL